MSKCNYCANKNAHCTTCTNECNFVPIEEVKEFFLYNPYNNPMFSKYMYDSTNNNLIKTHSIKINNEYYCPYCSDKMYPIQDKYSLKTYGYCCVCEGARAEIEFEKRLKDLKKKHEDEINELQSEYIDKLTFCTNKLIEIKVEKDKKSVVNKELTHFCTLNGEKYTDINQLI